MLLCLLLINCVLGPPTKQCPGCGNLIHIRKLTCSCGYAFKKLKAANPEVVNKQKIIAIVQKRALESVTENLKRKEVDKICKIKKRALESDAEAQKRKQDHRVQMSKKRALV